MILKNGIKKTPMDQDRHRQPLVSELEEDSCGVEQFEE
jgi:hypothetical protein